MNAFITTGLWKIDALPPRIGISLKTFPMASSLESVGLRLGLDMTYTSLIID